MFGLYLSSSLNSYYYLLKRYGNLRLILKNELRRIVKIIGNFDWMIKEKWLLEDVLLVLFYEVYCNCF